MGVETRYTSDSESSPRNRKLNTLQPHHATTKSLSGLESLMDPGGRTVSANEAMGPYGERVRKVPKNRRAFTSASAFDHQSYTVEVCNTSLDPEWGISDEAHRALADIAVELYLEGNLDGFHYGPGGILFHRDVPGTYATACPGPCMNYELIKRYALEKLGDDMDLNNDRFVNRNGDQITLPTYLNALEGQIVEQREIITRIEKAVTPQNAYGDVVPVGVIAAVAERKEDGSRAAIAQLAELLVGPDARAKVLAAYDSAARPSTRK